MTPLSVKQQSIRLGQVWKERDSRFFRLVRIVGIVEGYAVIENHEAIGKARRTRARLDRFGKRYDLWTEAKTDGKAKQE